MISSMAYANRGMVFFNDGFNPVVMQTHRIHYYQTSSGFYYVENRPRLRHVFYDPYSGRYMVLHQRHPIYIVNNSPIPVFQFNF